MIAAGQLGRVRSFLILSVIPAGSVVFTSYLHPVPLSSALTLIKGECYRRAE
jgi:hypothetical protein